MSDLIERIDNADPHEHGDNWSLLMESLDELTRLTAERDDLQYANDFCGKTIERLTKELDHAHGDIASIRDDKNDEISRLTTENKRLKNELREACAADMRRTMMYGEQVEQLSAEGARMREALEFISDANQIHLWDAIKRADEALATVSGSQCAHSRKKGGALYRTCKKCGVTHSDETLVNDSYRSQAAVDNRQDASCLDAGCPEGSHKPHCDHANRDDSNQES